MAWTTTDDLDDFLAAAGGFLRARPVEHTVLLGVAAVLGAAGPLTYGAGTPQYGWWQDPDGRVAGAYLWTPPRPPLLSPMPDRAADELAAALATGPRPVGGVNGVAATADAFAAGWRRRTGREPRLREHHRLYRLGTLLPPDPGLRGRPRTAGAADRALLTAWWGEFARELGEEPGRRADAVDDRLTYGGVTLWEADGRPVALAGVTRMLVGVARVAPVYTPPSLRRNGYAAGVTAAVSRSALAGGAREVVLFADTANRTSTALYQWIGFRPVSDHHRYDFP